MAPFGPWQLWRAARRTPANQPSYFTAAEHPPFLAALRPAGQPGVGKTCLVYRYLYNTFGETISESQSRQQLRAPAAAAGSSLSHTPFRCRPATRAEPPLRPPRQTIGASFAMKKVEANGRTCNLGIWVRRAQSRPRAEPLAPPRQLRPLAWRPRLAGHGGAGAIRLALELLLPRRPRRHHLL